jgi:hypothetical protein
MPKVDPLPRVPSLPAAKGETPGRAAAPEFLAQAPDPAAPTAERDRRTEDGAAGTGLHGTAGRRPNGAARRFAASGAQRDYARGKAADTGPEIAGEGPTALQGQRLDGRLAVLRANAADGRDLPTRPFIDQPTARALLDTLKTLPRSSRQDLESAVSQVEGLRQSYALPRATEVAASVLLTRLRAELRSLPPSGNLATAAPQKPTLEAGTARAILDSLTSPPPAGRQEIDAAAAQLVGLMSRYEMPAPLLRRAGGRLRGWEAQIGRLPPSPQERAVIAYLDALAFAPQGSGVPPLDRAIDELHQIGAYAARPFLHPTVREAADRALAFVRRGSVSVWERPSLWSLSSPRLQRSIFRQSEILLERFAMGQPDAVTLLSAMFDNDAARVRAFAGELAARAPAGSQLQQLALHVRDTVASDDGAPERLHVPARPGRPVSMAGPNAAAMHAAFMRLRKAMVYMSQVRL